jgi:DNA replication protein DnaC
MKECDMLIIDDYGKGRYTDDGRARVGEIIGIRYKHKRSIVITGNFESIDAMGAAVGARTFSRLMESANVAENKSIRDMRFEQGE